MFTFTPFSIIWIGIKTFVSPGGHSEGIYFHSRLMTDVFKNSNFTTVKGVPKDYPVCSFLLIF